MCVKKCHTNPVSILVFFPKDENPKSHPGWGHSYRQEGVINKGLDHCTRYFLGFFWSPYHVQTAQTADLLHYSCRILSTSPALPDSSLSWGSKWLELHKPKLFLHRINYTAWLKASCPYHLPILIKIPAFIWIVNKQTKQSQEK